MRRGRSCLGSRRQDKFEIMAHSRLCSLHFDKEQLQNHGHAVGFPKYFYWNNYGLVLNPRKSGAPEQWRSKHKPRQQSPPHPLQARTQSCRLERYANMHARRIIAQAPEVMQSFGEKATSTSGHFLHNGDSENWALLPEVITSCTTATWVCTLYLRLCAHMYMVY